MVVVGEHEPLSDGCRSFGARDVAVDGEQVVFGVFVSSADVKTDIRGIDAEGCDQVVHLLLRGRIETIDFVYDVGRVLLDFRGGEFFMVDMPETVP